MPPLSSVLSKPFEAPVRFLTADNYAFILISWLSITTSLDTFWTWTTYKDMGPFLFALAERSALASWAAVHGFKFLVIFSIVSIGVGAIFALSDSLLLRILPLMLALSHTAGVMYFLVGLSPDLSMAGVFVVLLWFAGSLTFCGGSSLKSKEIKVGIRGWKMDSQKQIGIGLIAGIIIGLVAGYFAFAPSEEVTKATVEVNGWRISYTPVIMAKVGSRRNIKLIIKNLKESRGLEVASKRSPSPNLENFPEPFRKTLRSSLENLFGIRKGSPRGIPNMNFEQLEVGKGKVVSPSYPPFKPMREGWAARDILINGEHVGSIIFIGVP